MAALTPSAAAEAVSVPGVPRPRRQPRSDRGRFGRWAVLGLVGLYFVLPFGAALEFSLRDGSKFSFAAYGNIVSQPGFTDALTRSATIAVATIVITLVLLVPTATWVRLRLPRWRRAVEAISLLPLVIPAVVLVTGVLSAFRSVSYLISSPRILALEYVVLALPFTYRILDAGLGAIDLVTLVEAARSLGARWPTVLLRVVVPNIRASIVGAAFLALSLVLGEFTVASLMLFDTFPTWLVQVGQDDAAVSVASSVLSLALVWAFLFVLSFAGSRRRGSESSP